jgi:hypothetical protein
MQIFQNKIVSIIIKLRNKIALKMKFDSNDLDF